MQQKARRIIDEIQKVVIGKEEIIQKILMAILANGHILLEDIPGVGKTTLAVSFSQAMQLQYKRFQFTPDTLPYDITGFSVFNRESRRLEYQPGAALCNLFLADEINRTSSKTQSALLEVMEEGKITVDGVSHEMPQPYTVIATQNPLGFAGTQELPESQIDRFMVCLSMGYPTYEDEVRILRQKHGDKPPAAIAPVVSREEVCHMQREAARVYVADELYQYAALLAHTSRGHKGLRLGLSPRGTIAVVKMAQASAYLLERDFVIPSDITAVFPAVAAHRLVLNNSARSQGLSREEAALQILAETKAPALHIGGGRHG